MKKAECFVVAAATVTLSQFTRLGWLLCGLYNKSRRLACVLTLFYSPWTMKWCWSQAWSQHRRDAATPSAAHRPDWILAWTQNFGLLSYWRFRKPPLYHWCCYHLLITGTPSSCLAQQDVSPEGEFCKLKSQTQVSWVLIQTSIPAKVQGVSKKALL